MTEVLTSQPEQSQRPVEIIHFRERDVIINNDSEYAHLGHQLAELFKDGVPEDWQPLGPTQDEYDEIDEPDHPALFGPKTGSALGEVAGVRFMVKPKYAGGIKNYNKRKEPPEYPDYTHEWSIKMARLFNSVLNEIAIAPQVKSITASHEAQELARKYGYKSVRFIEPIIAIIDKKTGDKSLVYEYIEDAQSMSLNIPTPRYWLDNKFVTEFDHLLWRNGIESNDHGGEQQFIFDKKKNLYHIDAESYSRV